MFAEMLCGGMGVGGKRPAITDKRLILKSRPKGRRRGEGSRHS